MNDGTKAMMKLILVMLATAIVGVYGTLVYSENEVGTSFAMNDTVLGGDGVELFVGVEYTPSEATEETVSVKVDTSSLPDLAPVVAKTLLGDAKWLGYYKALDSDCKDVVDLTSWTNTRGSLDLLGTNCVNTDSFSEEIDLGYVWGVLDDFQGKDIVICRKLDKMKYEAKNHTHPDEIISGNWGYPSTYDGVSVVATKLPYVYEKMLESGISIDYMVEKMKQSRL